MSRLQITSDSALPPPQPGACIGLIVALRPYSFRPPRLLFSPREGGSPLSPVFRPSFAPLSPMTCTVFSDSGSIADHRLRAGAGPPVPRFGFLDNIACSRVTGTRRINMHPAKAHANGDISTSGGSRHFYAALTNLIRSLALPSRVN